MQEVHIYYGVRENIEERIYKHTVTHLTQSELIEAVVDELIKYKVKCCNACEGMSESDKIDELKLIENLRPFVKHYISLELSYPLYEQIDSFDELVRYCISDFDDLIYGAAKDDYWDSIQEEDFDWGGFLEEHQIDCTFKYIWATKISNPRKVKLISYEARGDFQKGTNTFHFVVQDALTKKLFVFGGEPNPSTSFTGWTAVRLLTPEGLTEHEYVLYQLTHE